MYNYKDEPMPAAAPPPTAPQPRGHSLSPTARPQRYAPLQTIHIPDVHCSGFDTSQSRDASFTSLDTVRLAGYQCEALSGRYRAMDVMTISGNTDYDDDKSGASCSSSPPKKSRHENDVTPAGHTLLDEFQSPLVQRIASCFSEDYPSSFSHFEKDVSSALLSERRHINDVTPNSVSNQHPSYAEAMIYANEVPNPLLSDRGRHRNDVAHLLPHQRDVHGNNTARSPSEDIRQNNGVNTFHTHQRIPSDFPSSDERHTYHTPTSLLSLEGRHMDDVTKIHLRERNHSDDAKRFTTSDGRQWNGRHSSDVIIHSSSSPADHVDSCDKSAHWRRHVNGHTNSTTSNNNSSNYNSSDSNNNININSNNDINSNSHVINNSNMTNTNNTRNNAGRCLTKEKVLPPCRVCGNVASGFHYGCNTCEACKGFFRRALARAQTFRCKGNGQCTIKGAKRSVCAYCRYQRCLSLGMCKEAIKTGRYTHEKRTRDTLEVRDLNTTSDRDSTADDGTASLSEEDDVTARVTQAARQTSFLSTSHRSLQDIIYLRLASENKLLANGEAPFQRVMNCLNHVTSPGDPAQSGAVEFNVQQLSAASVGCAGGRVVATHDMLVNTIPQEGDGGGRPVSPISTEDSPPAALIDATEGQRIVGNYVQFGRSVPGFSSLCADDQTMLFRSAWVEISLLGNAFSRDQPFPREAYLAANVEVQADEDVHAPRPRGAFLARLAGILKKLGRLTLTSQELALTQALCLTFTDRVRGELGGRVEVEAIHWLVVRCLLNTLRRSHGKAAGAKFSEIISMLTNLRDISQEIEELRRKEHAAQC